MKLRDLFVSIGFDVDDSALTDLDRGLQKTKGLIVALGAATLASAGILYKMATSVADAGDSAAKTADKLGVQIEALQELRYAAELAGVAQNSFDTGLQRLTRRAAEAARGTGEAKDALRELGVQVTDGHGRLRNSADLLADIADGMAKIEDPGRRVALAFKLFDTEGVAMVNMLRDGKAALLGMRAEARELGFVIGEEAARNAEAFNDNLARTRLIITGLRNEVGARLLPIMSDLMVQFRQWFVYNREIIRSGIEKLLRGMITLLRWLYNAARIVATVMADVVEMLGGIERTARAAAWAISMFAGAYVLSALGNLAIGIGKVATGFRLLGSAALIAQAKIFAIPLLVGGLIVGLILAIQDLYTYIKGGDSLYGIIADKLLADSPRLQRIFKFTIGDIIDWIKKQFTSLSNWLEHWKSGIAAVFNWLAEKIRPVFDMIEAITKWLGGKLEAGTKSVGGVLESGTQALGGAIERAFGFLGMTPAAAPATAGASGHAGNFIRINAPINVNVPEGTPPAEVGRAVQNGVSDGISRMLRQTAEHTEPVDLW